MLSAEQTKAMLTSVARTHLAKLDRVAALEIADGITAGEGKRSDLVMAWAKRLQAARGPAASVEPGDHAAMTQSGTRVGKPGVGSFGNFGSMFTEPNSARHGFIAKRTSAATMSAYRTGSIA